MTKGYDSLEPHAGMRIGDSLGEPRLGIRKANRPFAGDACGIGAHPEIAGGLQSVEQGRTNEGMRLQDAKDLKQLRLRAVFGNEGVGSYRDLAGRAIEQEPACLIPRPALGRAELGEQIMLRH